VKSVSTCCDSDLYLAPKISLAPSFAIFDLCLHWLLLQQTVTHTDNKLHQFLIVVLRVSFTDDTNTHEHIPLKQYLLRQHSWHAGIIAVLYVVSLKALADAFEPPPPPLR